MFRYNKEMRDAIKRILLKIAKFRILNPDKNGGKPDHYEDARFGTAIGTERSIYDHIRGKYNIPPNTIDLETNDLSKAGMVAECLYNIVTMYTLKHRIGLENYYDWYLMLPLNEYGKKYTFEYNEEMEKSIKEELLKIAEFRIFSPDQNKEDIISYPYSCKEQNIWFAENFLYKNNRFYARKSEFETNDISKAKIIAEYEYKSFINSLKYALQTCGYSLNDNLYNNWYLLLPTKKFDK